MDEFSVIYWLFCEFVGSVGRAWMVLACLGCLYIVTDYMFRLAPDAHYRIA